MILHFVCKTTADTQDLAKTIGAHVRGGDVFAFKSDIGGGKTTFVKGLAAGMGVTDVVQSPTFTISQLHNAAHGLELHHFDFYRLSDAGIMRAELAESLSQPNAVVAIEWGDIVHDILPNDEIIVDLKNDSNDDTRYISITIPDDKQHVSTVLKGLK